MIPKIYNRKALKQALLHKPTRLKLVSQDTYLFAFFYLNASFKSSSPDWHFDLCQAYSNSIPYCLSIGFRGCGKTSFAKADILRRICIKQNRLMGVVCHQKETAEAHLFDIAVTLQSNQLIKSDFGQLYWEPEKKQKMSTKKKRDNFITSNGVQLFAASTKTPLRGRQFLDENGETMRPDYILADDFENTKTKKSFVETQGVKDFFREMLDGLAPQHKVIFVGNKISNIGSVAWIEGLAKEKPNNWVLFSKALIEDDAITWASRYVWTDREKQQLQEANNLEVYSIETLKKELAYFNQEYLNIPATIDDEVIKEEWIRDSFYNVLSNPDDIKYVVHLDPQAGLTDSADEYALTVVGFDKNNKKDIYLIEQIAGRDSVLKQTALFIKTIQKYRLQMVSATVEVVMNQTAVYELIIEWLNGKISLSEYGVDDDNRNVSFTKYNPKDYGGAKEDRILNQQAKFQRGEIHLKPEYVDLISQLVFMNTIKHDDRADSLLACIELANNHRGVDEIAPNRHNINKVKPISYGLTHNKF